MSWVEEPRGANVKISNHWCQTKPKRAELLTVKCVSYVAYL